MSVTVTLNVYSGLPNPTWELTDEQIERLREALRAARNTTLLKPPGLDGRLGYRGFRIHSVQEKGLEPFTIVHAGLADIDRFAPTLVLGDSELETWLLSTGEAVVASEVAAHVAEEIDGSALFRGDEKVRLLEPPYDPGKWNNDPSIRLKNNCYNYANDKITNTFAQPGVGSGQPGPRPPTCPGTGAAAQRDRLVSIANPNMTPAQGQIVALVVSSTIKDFHWYRRDSNGRWSHKPGEDPVKNTDGSAQPISDPQTCDRRPYDQFCGWYHAVPANTLIR